MFCPKCGNQMQDGTNFCPACGLQNPYAQVMNSQPSMQPNIQQQPMMQQPQQMYAPNMMPAANPRTNYADTSFKCAIWGLALCLCGLGFFAQPFALLFGILAIKNKEPETAKAWIGTVIGAIGTAIVVLIVRSWINGDF